MAIDLCKGHGMLECWNVGIVGTKSGARFIFFLILLLVFALHPPVATGSQTERDYRHARTCFERLLKDRQKQKLRHHWISCIKKFRSVYAAQPNGSRADDALLMTARLYAELYGYSGRIRDKQQAFDYYNRLLKSFPSNNTTQ